MANPIFKGFAEGPARMVPLPEAFFAQLLPQIDDLNELKLSLYIFQRLESVEGAFRYLRHSDLLADPALPALLAVLPAALPDALQNAIQQAVERGMLLHGAIDGEGYYFLNSPKGRAALRAIQNGTWRPSPGTAAPTLPPEEAPNIFRLYEQNVGVLNPIMAEVLGEAQDTYPADWIVEAIEIAVKNNKRTWRYINAILERWRQEGKHERSQKPDRPDTPETRRKYVEGQFSDFIKKD